MNNGMPFYDIDELNIASILPQLDIPEGVKDEIRESVNLGLTVKVSGSAITLNDWEGVGYILYDPNTGSGDYRIYGISGGRTGEEVKKGAVNGLLKMYLNQASVCAGSEYQDKTEDVEIESFIIALYVWHVLWMMKYMPFFLFPRTKQEFLKEVKREHNKVFFFAGHGLIVPTGVGTRYGSGIALTYNVYVTIEDVQSTLMPLYRFVFISACSSADYNIDGDDFPDGGFVNSFRSEGRCGYWHGMNFQSGSSNPNVYINVLSAVEIAKCIFDAFEVGHDLWWIRTFTIPLIPIPSIDKKKIFLTGPNDLRLVIP